MHISDGEAGLALGFQSAIRKTERAYDAAIVERDQHIQMLTAALQAARADLVTERAKRHALQFQVDRLNAVLDTPID
ncbi:hypothetical protein [Pelagibacterium sediminicola]|uniref:hypothetical protein n=1 Tax=Pelagibacterium sediminicola TaxID=2248761 RepID=UPI000E3246D7|nr:hypothetical protein [Pelagibacterium sediminicola]